ncbi:hypothetical protein GGI43DRAFT_393534 [Trichoderma evansii]
MTDAMFPDEKDAVASTAATPHMEYHPVANNSFMIRTRQNPHLYLTLENDELKVQDTLPPGGGWLWNCVKNCGWYGVRNTASGTYLGHDRKGNIVAKAPHHKDNEYFIVDRQSEGGYALLAWHGNQLIEVVLLEGVYGLFERVERTDVAAAWDFIDVKFVSVPVRVKTSL